jgi:putative nucleotidyltransferase with HDIG domain
VDTIDILNLRQWVFNYIKRFYSPDPGHQKNISLKELHTDNVGSNMVRIARSVLQNNSKVFLAEAIGLLHDIGRFSQYEQYRTFRDSISINHGKLGAEIIAKEDTLRTIPQHEQEIIIDAVQFHNAFSIPDVLDSEKIFFLKMIRDADKLDIWRVFTEQFSMNTSERASAADFGLPDLPAYSDSLLSCLRDKKQATLAGLKTLTDFKIMQLTWVYDLNFPVSHRMLSDSGHIDKIIAMLPQDDKITEAVSILRSHIRDKSAY